MNKVTIVDAICGKGKTSWAIQYMNNNEDKKFIYITPYLDEVERVIDGCCDRYFEQPEVGRGKGSKLEDFNNLLSQGKNIVSTHALFSLVNEDTLKYLKENDYTLILDEVFNVVDNIKITKSDREILLNGKIEVDNNNKCNWLDKEYDGTLNEYRKQIEHGDVYMYDNCFLLWTFPVSIFKAIKETYILTYMFNGQLQRYYYDMNNISYEYKSVATYQKEVLEDSKPITKTFYKLIDYIPNEDLTYLKELINICDNDKLNAIGKPKDKRSNPLSKSWYDNQNRKKLDGLDILRKNMENYFQKICKGKSNENMWTTFKEFKNKCSGKGFKGRDMKDKDGREKNTCFIPCGTRATNEYRHKKNLAYCINVFNNPIYIKFFTSKGVTVDEDTYALSELIQWIFRSQLRDNKPINLYIPSERMRNLFINWLNNK